jgi:hypothetical protein
MALAQQTILRAARLESGLFTACLNEAMDPLGKLFIPMSQELAGDGNIEITRAQNRNYALGVGFHRVARQSNSITLMLRSQAQAERQYRRAVEEFERLKALRVDLPDEEPPNEPTTDPQPEQNEPGCAPPESNPSVGPSPSPGDPETRQVPRADGASQMSGAAPSASGLRAATYSAGGEGLSPNAFWTFPNSSSAAGAASLLGRLPGERSGHIQCW